MSVTVACSYVCGMSLWLWRVAMSVALPDMVPQEAAKSFSRFFQEKIETIRQEFNDDPLDTTENFASSVHSSDILCRCQILFFPHQISE